MQLKDSTYFILKYVEDLNKLITVREKQVIATMATSPETEHVN